MEDCRPSSPELGGSNELMPTDTRQWPTVVNDPVCHYNEAVAPVRGGQGRGRDPSVFAEVASAMRVHLWPRPTAREG